MQTPYKPFATLPTVSVCVFGDTKKKGPLFTPSINGTARTGASQLIPPKPKSPFHRVGK